MCRRIIMLSVISAFLISGCNLDESISESEVGSTEQGLFKSFSFSHTLIELISTSTSFPPF